EDGIRDRNVTGVQTCALPISVDTFYDVNLVDVHPEQSVAEQDAAEGKDLFARDPARCCALRKVAPLSRALAGYDAWITGIRRVRSEERRVGKECACR